MQERDQVAPQAGSIVKWLKAVGSSVCSGDRLCSLLVDGGATVFLYAKISGQLESQTVSEGALVQVGDVLGRISPCRHPAVFNNMCVSCGEKVTLSTSSKSASSGSSSSSSSSSASASSSTSMTLTLGGGGQQLHVSEQEAARVQEAKLSDLQRIRKIALILDLDHTLVHATEIGGPPQALEEGVSLLVLEDTPVFGGAKHHLLAKRPHLDWFLQEAHKFCQMTIYTAATRRYAEAVAKIIDPTGKMFTGRMVSRSDIPNGKLSNGLEKSLQRLFLGDSSMAVIIDDRSDVWKGEQANQLLVVKPFKHFKDAREINNAAGQEAQGAALIALAGPRPGEYLGPTDKDDQLIRCLDLLKVLHSQYYDGLKQSGVVQVSMGRLMTTLRSEVLAGCVIAFSGIIPTNEKDPSSNWLWQLAISLGAQVSLSVIPRTTHLVSLHSHTQKVVQCLQRGDIWVLHPDWLLHCRWSLARVLETTFMLATLPPGKELPNPVLDASPIDDVALSALTASSSSGVLQQLDDAQQGAPSRGVKRAFHSLGEEKHTTLENDVIDDDYDDDDDDGFGDDFDDIV